MDGEALYAAVNGIVTSSCAFIRCHDPSLPPGGGGLLFEAGKSVRGPLVGVPSCEYDAMKRVEPGAPDRSWLMVKLSAPRKDTYEIEFTPTAKYDPNTGCGTAIAPDGTPGFGFGMPATGQFHLEEVEIKAFREWIEAGAPGPD